MARWLCRLFVLAVFGGMALTAFTAPAAAHGQLALTIPAKDSTVREPLESVSLYFTEMPAPIDYFTVTSPSGKRVDQPWSRGEPKRLDEPIQEYHLVDGVWEPRVFNTGLPAQIPVAYWPEHGVYVIRYLTIASDGELVKGDVRFTYKGKTSGPPKGWQAPTNEPDPTLLAPEHGTSPASAVPETGGTQAAVPETGQSQAPVPETGSSQAAVPEIGTSGAAAQTARPSDSGSGLSVWLVPAIVVVAAGFMVARAARRRPAPTGPAARRRPGGQPAKKTSRAPASRNARRPGSAKRR
ncbi:copper resistance protein CopC [Microbispora sp. RL4-1S]|uniref:Copper resistance protein CopC n=1 Tax=Microbispora oryzae TaxID=2806554 RepID=A0A941ARI6_9ACTN|nr:copper resistance protein CopC [Microbispora oryzae]MBP2706154.1 copper resistance protein CopC [Microbispora oryzae]